MTVIPNEIGNMNTREDHPNDSTVKIGQNTEKSPGHSNSSERPSADAGVKKSERSKMIIVKVHFEQS